MSAVDAHVDVIVERLQDPQGIAVIRLQADERKNALTGESARAIRAALAEVDADPDLAAVVVTGGPAFCAGAHREVLAAAGREEAWAVEDLQDVYGIFSDLRALSIPTVAAVRGPAVGAGLNIALACDVRIVADDAYLRSMFIANAIHPGGAHLKMLWDLAGGEIATHLAVFDNPMRGTQFAAAGLAVSSLPDGDVEAGGDQCGPPCGSSPGAGALDQGEYPRNEADDRRGRGRFRGRKAASHSDGERHYLKPLT